MQATVFDVLLLATEGIHVYNVIIFIIHTHTHTHTQTLSQERREGGEGEGGGRMTDEQLNKSEKPGNETDEVVQA